MRDLAIKLLKEHNQSNTGSIITKLYYGDDGDYVEDFSFFLQSEDYFSYDLFSAIRNGQSLTTKQEEEKRQFIIEGHLNMLVRQKLGTDIDVFMVDRHVEKKSSQNITVNVFISDKDKLNVDALSKQIKEALERSKGIK